MLCPKLTADSKRFLLWASPSFTFQSKTSENKERIFNFWVFWLYLLLILHICEKHTTLLQSESHSPAVLCSAIICNICPSPTAAASIRCCNSRGSIKAKLALLLFEEALPYKFPFRKLYLAASATASECLRCSLTTLRTFCKIPYSTETRWHIYHISHARILQIFIMRETNYSNKGRFTGRQSCGDWFLFRGEALQFMFRFQFVLYLNRQLAWSQHLRKGEKKKKDSWRYIACLIETISFTGKQLRISVLLIWTKCCNYDSIHNVL